MCGIAGWAFGPRDDERLHRALGAEAHRGPDGEGVWVGSRASLGHRRLAIIDLSDRAAQPMSSPDGAVHVTFNGEIYNFHALRDELGSRCHFRSSGDTEVLVHGYEIWGLEGLLERIAGMFAFAIWDERRGLLHLARDRIGKKPLYYAREGGRLAFASTLPSLLHLLPTMPSLRADALADYLHYFCVPQDKSILEGVLKLPPGTAATFDGASLTLRRYWRLSFATQERRTADDWCDQVDAELRRATADRLVADVPVGVFLSGGVDSSLVTAMAAGASSSPITTISAGFDEASFDESRWARQVAQHLGTHHLELTMRPDAAADLPRLVYATGEPHADIAVLPTMCLARAAREHVKVVLTGDGGDEGFAGYPDALIARLAPSYARLVPRRLRAHLLPALLARAAQLPGPLARTARRLRRLAEADRGTFRWGYDNLGEKAFRGQLDELLLPLAPQLGSYDPDAIWDQLFAATDGPTLSDRVLALELGGLLPDLYLTKTDTATMAYGLEARCPFLDARLLELAARIPAATKLEGLRGKALLKRLAARKGLPVSAMTRRKQGFSVPVGAWLRGPLTRAVDDFIVSGLGRRGLVDERTLRRLVAEHRSGREHGQRLWALLILELWLRLFVDRTMTQGDALA